MKYVFFVNIFALLCVNSFGQVNDKVWNYIQQYHSIAISEMQRTGIPASITLAQGLLESGIGESRLAKKGNNHFGIKCHDWQGPTMKHNDDKPNECFRVYGSAYESYIDHSDFLKNRSRYNSLFQYATTDYVNWAKGLKACGYATNPKYAELLIERIEKYYLNIFDKTNWQELFNMVNLNRQLSQGETVMQTTTTYYGNDLPVASPPATVYQSSTKTAPSITPNKAIVLKEPVNETRPVVQSKTNLNVKETSNYKEKEVEIKNDVIVVPTFTIKTINGKSAINYNLPINLLQVSRDYGISIKKLMDYNEVTADYMFAANSNIFTQKKRKRYKGEQAIHKAAPGQTLHSIAQKYGLCVKHLKKINKLSANETPKTGAKIKLKDELKLFGK